MKPKATYEQQLDDNAMRALREGSGHFEEANGVHKTLLKITKKLEELEIPLIIPKNNLISSDLPSPYQTHS